MQASHVTHSSQVCLYLYTQTYSGDCIRKQITRNLSFLSELLITDGADGKIISTLRDPRNGRINIAVAGGSTIAEGPRDALR